jgi:hypothetical protein
MVYLPLPDGFGATDGSRDSCGEENQQMLIIN